MQRTGKDAGASQSWRRARTAFYVGIAGFFDALAT